MIYLKSIAIFHTSSGKAGIKAGVVLSVFYRRVAEFHMRLTFRENLPHRHKG